MTEFEKARVTKAIRKAVNEAIDVVGMDGLKKMSMFLSSNRISEKIELDKAA